MPNSFINFCYNVAGKREIKKPREDGQYVLLTGDTHGHVEATAPIGRDEDSDSSEKSPAKKMDFINKFFKAKAKNSDDEANISSIYDNSKGNETDSSAESNDLSAKNESKGVVNRKKKKSFYDKKGRQQKKHPGSAKVKLTQDKPKKDKETAPLKKGDEDEAPFETSSTEVDLKPTIILSKDKDCILEQFDPLWTGDVKNEDKLDIPMIGNKPVKPPKNKITNKKVLLSENLSVMKIPELKVATMEAIQENELLIEEKIFEEIPKDDKDEQAKANVLYEGLEGVFARPIIHDNFEDVKEDECPIVAEKNAFDSDAPIDSASISFSEVPPVFVQPRKNPWNVWPGLFEDSLGIPANDAFADTMNDDSKNTFQKWLEDSNSGDESGTSLFNGTDEEEKRTNKMIADFFAEETRALNEHDIANYSTNIEISKIEIYAEDIKKYHESLKYHRGPIDHDIIFTTVETALNFIEKLEKEREQKKKVSFLPELLEKCLKGKARKEKQNEEEERKKKEKEENKKKGPLKPKMWLIFNRLSKEKVIVCTPGEFYDSD